jgi:CMP-N-acetylneuraminic acid synthetase
MKRTGFITVRSGSSRSIDKNVKPFLPDGTSLLQNRLLQLTKVICDEIIVSTNCKVCKAQTNEISKHDRRIKIVNRTEDLCVSKTKVSEIMKHIASESKSETILWTHVTAPFISSEDMNNAFTLHEDKNDYDSVVSVNKIQNYLWDKDKKIVSNNYNKNNKWPNTQDLYPLYEFNHAIYVCSKNLLSSGERVGNFPYLYECHAEAKIDIDWERDFKYAQQLSKISLNTESLTDFYKTL